MDDLTDDLEAARTLRDRAAQRVAELEAAADAEAARQRSRRAEIVGLAVDHLLTDRGARERRRDLALWYLLAICAPGMKRDRLVRELRLWVDDGAKDLAATAVQRDRPSADRIETMALCRRAGVEPPPSRSDRLADQYRPEDAVDGVLDALEARQDPPTPDQPSSPRAAREG